MIAPLHQSLTQSFRQSARLEEARHREINRMMLAERREKEEKQRREESIESIDDLVALVMASTAEIDALTVRLDSYDAATIEALTLHGEELAQVRERIASLLGQAYILPDGRRVFRTEDGSRVFDEHGVEVTDLDPDEIEEWRPHWEV